MLSRKQIEGIWQLKDKMKFNIKFINSFDEEWRKTINRLKNSRVNLSEIYLIDKPRRLDEEDYN